MKFAKGDEQNFSTDISDCEGNRAATPTRLRVGRFKSDAIDGQFYQEELTLVRVTKSTVYKIDKILDE